MLNRLSAIDWAVPLVVVTLEGHHLPLLEKFEQLPARQLGDGGESSPRVCRELLASLPACLPSSAWRERFLHVLAQA